MKEEIQNLNPYYLLSKKQEEFLVNLLRDWLKKNGSCAAGKAQWNSTNDIEEIYDNFKDPIHVIWGGCKYFPDETFMGLLKIIIHDLPKENAPQQLLEAREALLNYRITNKELQECANKIEKPPKLSHPWTEYYRIIYYMMLWKLKLREPTVAIPIMEKMKKLLKTFGMDQNVLLNSIKQTFPYEKFLYGLISMVKTDDRKESGKGRTDYIPMSIQG